MKKILLISLIALFSTSSFSQYYYQTAQKKQVKQVETTISPDQISLNTDEMLIGQKATSMIGSAGTTWYDLQSYTNIMNRIYEYPDGTVGAIWMAAGENLEPNRGTGYNYYENSSWDALNMHIGDDPRTGWPSYAPWGENGEIVSHYWYDADALPGPIKFFRREVKGEGDWIESEAFGPDGLSIVWATMMTSGENNEHIHLLARTYDAPYMGQENALLYYRSSDGGETWDIEHEIIEGLGEDYFPASANLHYAWARPNGGAIAFCYGFDDYDGMVFKSTDNGESWEKTVVFESSIDPFDIPTDSDIIPCGDGSCAIALDSEGKAHITFSKKLMIYVEGAYQWYPTATDGVIYWNESMAPLDTTIISSYTNEFLIEGGYLAGYMLPDDEGSYEILEEQSNYGNQSMTSFSQLAIDDNDNIFLVYSSLAPGFDNAVMNYRHILVNVSFNGGSLWIGAEDLTNDLLYLFSECVYPAISPAVGDKIHIIFQEDSDPGIYEWLTNHDAHENSITHLEYDKFYFTDMKEASLNAEGLELSQNYPNPAINTTYFSVQLGTSSEVTMELRNSIGQTVTYYNYGILNQGKTNLSMDVSELPAGIYYYTVFANDQRKTQKLIVQ